MKLDFPSDRFRDDADASSGLMFVRAYNAWHARMKAVLHTHGITLPQFELLASLNFLRQRHEHVSQVQLARHADMDAMTASQVLRALEKKDYIRRVPNPDDTRAKAVELLSKGLATVYRTLPVVVAVDDAFFGVLGEHEATFRALLGKLPGR